MATQSNGAGSFLANAVITAFHGVTISNNRGIGASATAVVPIGIAQRDAAAGDYVTVKFFSGPGTHKMSITGAPVTRGDIVYAGTAGQCVRTGGTVAIGIALNSASTNGSIIEVAPTF